MPTAICLNISTLMILIKRMPVYLLSICLLLAAHGVSAQQKATGIIWSRNKLTWNDYQEDNSYEKYPGILARTHTKLHVDEIDTTGYLEKKGINVNVYALMIPVLSWVSKSSLSKTSVLAHEQLHFDIVELIARQFRKQLSGQKITIKNYEKVINTIKKQYFRKLKNMQKEYDQTHRQQWNKWVTTLANGISELENYRSITVFMTLEN